MNKSIYLLYLVTYSIIIAINYFKNLTYFGEWCQWPRCIISCFSILVDIKLKEKSLALWIFTQSMGLDSKIIVWSRTSNTSSTAILSFEIKVKLEISHFLLILILYHKLRERKVKTLTRNWRDHWRTGAHKHTETVSRYFDRHGRLSQSEESKCLWTHDKEGTTLWWHLS